MNKLTRAYARMLLIRKAKRGIWDPRMCSIHGVSPKVNHACQRFIVRAYARLLIPTSTTGGQHSATSYHPKGMAVDVGVVPALVGTRTHLRRLLDFQHTEYHAHQDGERSRMLELIGPADQQVVLRGVRSPITHGSDLEIAHRNHVHGAFR